MSFHQAVSEKAIIFNKILSVELYGPNYFVQYRGPGNKVASPPWVPWRRISWQPLSCLGDKLFINPIPIGGHGFSYSWALSRGKDEKEIIPMAEPISSPKLQSSAPVSPEPQISDEKPDLGYYIMDLRDPDYLMGRARFLYSAQTLGNDASFFSDQNGPGFALDAGIKLRFDHHLAWGGVGYQFNHTSRNLNGGGKSYLNTNRFGVTGGYRYALVPEWFSLGVEAFLGLSHFLSNSDIIEAGATKAYDPNTGTVFNGNPVGHSVDSLGLATQLGINVGIWRDIIGLGFLIGGDWGGEAEIDSLDPSQGSYYQSINPLTLSFYLGVEIPSLFSDRTF